MQNPVQGEDKFQNIQEFLSHLIYSSFDKYPGFLIIFV